MTVYRTSIQTTPTDFNGQTHSSLIEERENVGRFVSTADLRTDGPTAIDGKTGAVKAITDLADLNPEDRIEVAGIPMTVKQAREAGITLKLDARPTAKSDTNLETVPRARSNDVEEQPEVDMGPTYTTDGERIAGDTMVRAFQLHTGLSRSEVEEMGADIVLGAVADDDELWGALSQRGMSAELRN